MNIDQLRKDIRTSKNLSLSHLALGLLYQLTVKEYSKAHPIVVEVKNRPEKINPDILVEGFKQTLALIDKISNPEQARTMICAILEIDLFGKFTSGSTSELEPLFKKYDIQLDSFKHIEENFPQNVGIHRAIHRDPSEASILVEYSEEKEGVPNKLPHAETTAKENIGIRDALLKISKEFTFLEQMQIKEDYAKFAELISTIFIEAAMATYAENGILTFSPGEMTSLQSPVAHLDKILNYWLIFNLLIAQNLNELNHRIDFIIKSFREIEKLYEKGEVADSLIAIQAFSLQLVSSVERFKLNRKHNDDESHIHNIADDSLCPKKMRLIDSIAKIRKNIEMSKSFHALSDKKENEIDSYIQIGEWISNYLNKIIHRSDKFLEKKEKVETLLKQDLHDLFLKELNLSLKVGTEHHVYQSYRILSLLSMVSPHISNGGSAIENLMMLTYASHLKRLEYYSHTKLLGLIEHSHVEYVEGVEVYEKILDHLAKLTSHHKGDGIVDLWAKRLIDLIKTKLEEVLTHEDTKENFELARKLLMKIENKHESVHQDESLSQDGSPQNCQMGLNVTPRGLNVSPRGNVPSHSTLNQSSDKSHHFLGQKSEHFHFFKIFKKKGSEEEGCSNHASKEVCTNHADKETTESKASGVQISIV